MLYVAPQSMAGIPCPSPLGKWAGRHDGCSVVWCHHGAWHLRLLCVSASTRATALRVAVPCGQDSSSWEKPYQLAQSGTSGDRRKGGSQPSR